jgi:hypothetical protein
VVVIHVWVGSPPPPAASFSRTRFLLPVAAQARFRAGPRGEDTVAWAACLGVGVRWKVRASSPAPSQGGSEALPHKWSPADWTNKSLELNVGGERIAEALDSKLGI